jgi:hypothetical protein
MASENRYLQRIGKPQIYGTQFLFVDGAWTLEPIDTTALTDSRRGEWEVPSQAKSREYMNRMNESASDSN